MPHSVSGSASPPTEEDNSSLPDAPSPHASEQDSQTKDGIGKNDNIKIDIKLEDIFNDEDDEDEEFPSSEATKGKMESSPPAAPM